MDSLWVNVWFQIRFIVSVILNLASWLRVWWLLSARQELPLMLYLWFTPTTLPIGAISEHCSRSQNRPRQRQYPKPGPHGSMHTLHKRLKKCLFLVSSECLIKNLATLATRTHFMATHWCAYWTTVMLTIRQHVRLIVECTATLATAC